MLNSNTRMDTFTAEFCIKLIYQKKNILPIYYFFSIKRCHSTACSLLGCQHDLNVSAIFPFIFYSIITNFNQVIAIILFSIQSYFVFQFEPLLILSDNLEIQQQMTPNVRVSLCLLYNLPFHRCGKSKDIKYLQFVCLILDDG